MMPRAFGPWLSLGSAEAPRRASAGSPSSGVIFRIHSGGPPDGLEELLRMTALYQLTIPRSGGGWVLRFLGSGPPVRL